MSNKVEFEVAKVNAIITALSAFRVKFLFNPIQPEGQSCVRALYGNRSQTTITVYNTATQPDNSPTQICGYAYQPDPTDEPARLAVV